MDNSLVYSKHERAGKTLVFCCSLEPGTKLNIETFPLCTFASIHLTKTIAWLKPQNAQLHGCVEEAANKKMILKHSGSEKMLIKV